MSSEEHGGPPGHSPGGPPVQVPGSPPQSKREGSRWRRKRPSPSAARPLILFSLLTSIIFVGVLSAVFLPKILEPQENLPQFFFADPDVGATETTVRVTDATGPRAFSGLRLLLRDTDASGSTRETANATLDQLAPGPVRIVDANSNGWVDSNDAFVVATEPGHRYVLSIAHVATGKVVAWKSFP